VTPIKPPAPTGAGAPAYPIVQEPWEIVADLDQFSGLE
jgi:hypothetical protein